MKKLNSTFIGQLRLFQLILREFIKLKQQAKEIN